MKLHVKIPLPSFPVYSNLKHRKDDDFGNKIYFSFIFSLLFSRQVRRLALLVERKEAKKNDFMYL